MTPLDRIGSGAHEEAALSPRIIPRKCGGWLAVSNAADPVQIGITAATEACADLEFKIARKRWQEILSDRTAASATTPAILPG